MSRVKNFSATIILANFMDGSYFLSFFERDYRMPKSLIKSIIQSLRIQKESTVNSENNEDRCFQNRENI